MMAFRAKEISSSNTLGERLQSHRLNLGYSVEEIASVTEVSKKYIMAIEAGQYQALPGEVYVRNFLRAYAAALNLDIDDVLTHYDREHRLVKTVVRQRPTFVARHVDAKPWLTPRRGRALALVVAVLVVISYLGWEVWSILRPPELIIETPAPELTTTNRTVEIRGVTDKESEVIINGQKVVVGSNGRFVEDVSLQLGLNTIRITAARKRSKTSVIYRRIFVQQPKAGEQ